jgi:hypothetical protein
MGGGVRTDLKNVAFLARKCTFSHPEVAGGSDVATDSPNRAPTRSGGRIRPTPKYRKIVE